MIPSVLNAQIITPALQLLGEPRFDKHQARVQMIAIALQETGLRARIQKVGSPPRPVGPARSYWQFERMGGVNEVMVHPATGPRLKPIVELLDLEWDVTALHQAMAYNDLVAAVMARLLIYIDPRPLPVSAPEGWAQYLARWRPGKPHPQTWLDNWRVASGVVHDEGDAP